jgi:uncharacterized integral membrane protein (TIGR00698 family)
MDFTSIMINIAYGYINNDNWSLYLFPDKINPVGTLWIERRGGIEMIRRYVPGMVLCAMVASVSMLLSSFLPGDLIGSTVMALLVGMALNPIVERYGSLQKGITFSGKMVLRLGIILMGVTLSFSQVLDVGRYSLFVMLFTMATAFGAGNLIGRLFKMDWKLTNLLAVSTAICGGSAVAALGPTIDADDAHIAYAISATFLFDVVTVVAFPWIGRLLGLGDMGYGLWTGTAVNDTSSVVAAGYAFSGLAGGFAVIVKLTRTLFIIPIVMIFSLVQERISSRGHGEDGEDGERKKVDLNRIFPWFILVFLGVVALKSTGILSPVLVSQVSMVSKFSMVMALSAIGLKTSYRDVVQSGFKPMVLGFTIDTLVVIVSLGVQVLTGRI